MATRRWGLRARRRRTPELGGRTRTPTSLIRPRPVSSQESRCESDSEQPPDYSMMLRPRPSASVRDHAVTAGGIARCNLWVTPTGGQAYVPPGSSGYHRFPLEPERPQGCPRAKWWSSDKASRGLAFCERAGTWTELRTRQATRGCERRRHRLFDLLTFGGKGHFADPTGIEETEPKIAQERPLTLAAQGGSPVDSAGRISLPAPGTA